MQVRDIFCWSVEKHHLHNSGYSAAPVRSNFDQQEQYAQQEQQNYRQQQQKYGEKSEKIYK